MLAHSALLCADRALDVQRTLDYLFHDLLDQDPELKATHGFLRDRTRSIRQDFSVQSDKGPISIECHERMARYHIHCIHVMCESEGFSCQQELEQLRKGQPLPAPALHLFHVAHYPATSVLTSLMEFYSDRRQTEPSTSSSPSPASPNEAEFSAYLLLTHLWDADILRQTENLPSYLFHSQEVQLALSFAYLAQRNSNTEIAQTFFTRFFKNVSKGSTPYLVACLLESHFGEVRKAAFLALKRGLMKNFKPMPIEDLVGPLGCDDELDVAGVCEEFGLEVEWDDDAPLTVKLFRDATMKGEHAQPCLRIVR